MTRITRDFSSTQVAAVRQLESPEDIPSACPQNFNLFSECFAAIAFNSISDVGQITYTIRADAGIAHIDVVKHTSDFELRILPLQWAIDKVGFFWAPICVMLKLDQQAIIELRIGEEVQTPIQWPFTQVTNAEQDRDIRLSEFFAAFYSRASLTTPFRLHSRTTDLVSVGAVHLLRRNSVPATWRRHVGAR